MPFCRWNSLKLFATFSVNLVKLEKFDVHIGGSSFKKCSHKAIFSVKFL